MYLQMEFKQDMGMVGYGRAADGIKMGTDGMRVEENPGVTGVYKRCDDLGKMVWLRRRWLRLGL